MADGDSLSPPSAATGSGGMGMRRNKTVAAFNTSTTSNEFDVPSAPRTRLSSFDMGWIKKGVRRLSLDPNAESNAASVAKTTTDNTDSAKVPAVTIQSVNAEQVEAPRMERRKSESVLWKWFNTPMSKENDVRSLRIAEGDESGQVGSGALTAIAQQMSQQSQEANKHFTIGTDRGGLSIWGKVTKDKMATRDMNAISPSNW